MGQKIFTVETIPHKDQVYPTVGYYATDKDGCLNVKISKMKDRRYVVLVALHEIIEAELCRVNGITDKKIDAFDIRFEKDRAKGRHGPEDEPGDDPKAPYRRQHLMATAIEKMLAAEMGVDWKAYEKAIGAL